MTADFVVVKNNKIVGVFESKVNSSELSQGQRELFNEGTTGTLTGKNAGQYAGVEVSSKTTETTVYRWNSETGSYIFNGAPIKK